MTVSHPDRLASATIVAVAVWGLISGGALIAQESPEAPQPAEQTSDAEATETPARSDTARPYLGERPTLPRQKGPSVGKARSILPEPYVAIGSIPVPALPEKAVVDGVVVDAAGGPNVDSEGEALQNIEGLDSTVPTENQGLSEDDYESGALEDLDPSLVAVGGADAQDLTDLNFWAGYSHETAAERLMAYSKMVSRPAARGIFTDIALGAFDLEGAGDPVVLLKARLSLLEAAGDRSGYQSLIADLPVDQDWTQLEYERARAALYQGDLVTACDLAAQARGRDTDSFWLKIGIMCAAARGERSSVDFQLGILEEAETVSAGFYELSDLILVEAEQGSRTESALGAPLPVDSLSVAMARLAGATVGDIDLEGASPIGIDAALTLPTLSPSAQADLLQAALARTKVDTASLAGTLRSMVLSQEDKTSLFIDAETDPTFEVDVKLMALLADQSAPALDRQSAMRSVWSRGKSRGVLPGLAPVLVELSQDMPRTGEAFDSLRLRAALMADDKMDQTRLFAGLRATGTADKPARAHALVAAVPLLEIAGSDSGVGASSELIDLWIENRGTVALSALEAMPGQTQLMLAVLEGRGRPVESRHWDRVQSDEALAAKAANPAAWRQLIEARRSGDHPRLLGAAFALLSSGNALSLSPAMVSSALFTLEDAGQSDIAGALALELLLEAGL